jgi:N-acyl-phosphatidylethanolamine-hydrolysing phospholipase D
LIDKKRRENDFQERDSNLRNRRSHSAHCSQQPPHFSRTPMTKLTQFVRPLARVGVVVVTGVMLTLAGCETVNPYYDKSKPHHTATGFSNRYGVNPSGEGFWKWQRQRVFGDLPAQDATRVPRVSPKLDYLRTNRRDITVTWIGHATALWQIGGLNVLTDPHFTERASPVSFAGPKREVPLPMALSALPRIDVALISHNHYDHLDVGTVKVLNAQAGGPPLFIVPLGVDLWMKQQGIDNVVRMDWWQMHVHGGVKFHFVPAQHWSSRSPYDRSETLWGGFVAEVDQFKMYFVGDTGYSRDFKDIHARFGGFDFAQIPVGCYEPRWFMQPQHVNETEAVQIHRDVASKFSMGVHWGTFRLCDDPVESPLDGLPKARDAQGVKAEEFVLMALGETRVLKAAP